MDSVSHSIPSGHISISNYFISLPVYLLSLYTTLEYNLQEGKEFTSFVYHDITAAQHTPVAV